MEKKNVNAKTQKIAVILFNGAAYTFLQSSTLQSLSCVSEIFYMPLSLAAFENLQ